MKIEKQKPLTAKGAKEGSEEIAKNAKNRRN